MLKEILLGIIVCIVFLSACNRAPELPIIPKIQFEEIQFKEVDGPDSLIVFINFEDGDGDLGLTSNDIFDEYAPYFVVLDENNDTIKYGSRPGLPDYNPIDYVILRDEDGVATDTILVEINENHYNYFIRFFTKKNGEYTEFDWRAPPYYQTLTVDFHF